MVIANRGKEERHWRTEERIILLSCKGDIYDHFRNRRYFRWTLKLKLARQWKSEGVCQIDVALSWVLFLSRSSAKVRAVLAAHTSVCPEPSVWDDKLWVEPAINHSCQTKEKAVYKFLQGEPSLHYLNQDYFMLCFASFRISFWNMVFIFSFWDIFFKRNLAYQISCNF